MTEKVPVKIEGVFTVLGEQNNGLGSQNSLGNQSVVNLVPISSRSSLFQRKNILKYVVLFLSFWIVLLFIALAIVLLLYYRKENNCDILLCTSEECLKSAANIKLSMNFSVDPCEDFYQFSCGRWSDEHPNHGWVSRFSNFETTYERIIFSTMKFLNSNETDSEPLPVKQTRYLYQSCINIESTNKLGFSVIYSYLKEIGLPIVPDLFSSQNNTESVKFDWIQTEVNIKKTFAMDTFIGFSIDANIYNRSENVIYLGIPVVSSYLPRYFTEQRGKMKSRETIFEYFEVDGNIDKADDEEDELKEKEIIKMIMKTIFKNISAEISTDEIEMAVNILWNITEDLHNLYTYNYTLSQNIDCKIFKLNEFENYTNQCIDDKNRSFVEDLWSTYLLEMFKNTENVSFHIDENTLIYVSVAEIDYLCKILSYISNLSDQSLQLYYWWVVVDSMIISTTSEISEFIWEIMDLSTSPSIGRSRSVECTSLVINYMGMAVSYGILNTTFVSSTIPKVNEMIDNLKEAFVERVEKITWMDEQTKQATLDKTEAIISLIGYPDYILNERAVEEYYANISISSDKYLENMINIIKTYTPYWISKLGKKNDRVKWRTDPTTTNAYNYFPDNAITVPMAILTFPFYNLGLEVLDYGALGSIIGHELTHGFDITGRKFDKYGNYKEWWSNNTVETFEKKTECFIQQYNNLSLPQLNTKIDGQKTLAENLADNGGLHHAFLAYQKYKSKNPPEKMLPGLQNFSIEQLFFIAYGSVWCEEFNSYVTNNQLKVDEHSPNYARVIATLQNSEEFAKAFNCPLGSKMNPNENRCIIW